MSETKQKKRFFTNHSKSSALVVSLAIHGILILVALSFVAVTVIQKKEKNFEYKKVVRPKQTLKKLQVPVKVKKNKPKPKLRKRLVVKNVTRKTPEFKMPEITGMKGGLGAMGGGSGMESIGFSLPEIDIFGVKGRGEKIFIILDSSPDIMEDRVGGIPAYTLIKEELLEILENLNPAVLFNVAVYDYNLEKKETKVVLPFSKLVSASPSNVDQVKKWLAPLNSKGKYGAGTLGEGGLPVSDSLVVEPLKVVRQWSKPMMVAMQQQADSIFVLTSDWGRQYHVEEKGSWSGDKKDKWNEKVAEANKELRKENKIRREQGKPPRIIAGGTHRLVKTYFPSAEMPPTNKTYDYSPKEMVKGFSNQRKASQSGTRAASSLTGNKFTINVVHFVGKGSSKKSSEFQTLTKLTKGKYRVLPGLDAIASSVSKKQK